MLGLHLVRLHTTHIARARSHPLSTDSLPPLLAHLRQIYRWQNSYHNFEHALDVLQATYCYLRDAGLVPSITVLLDESHGESGAEQVTHRMWKPESLLPPTSMAASLNNLDLFVVCIAAIGHDVGHPGFTNLFMVYTSLSPHSAACR